MRESNRVGSKLSPNFRARMQSEAEQWRQQPRFSRFTVRQDRAANELKARPRSFRVKRVFVSEKFFRLHA